MALYISHSVFHLARLLYVRPETFGPYYVSPSPYIATTIHDKKRRLLRHVRERRRKDSFFFCLPVTWRLLFLHLLCIQLSEVETLNTASLNLQVF
jgi:hypothetical protein